MKRILATIISIALVMSGCTLLGNSSEDGDPTVTLPKPLVTTVFAPNPDDTARQYLDAWKMSDYGAMYSLLSPLSQDGMDLEMFVETYEEIERSGAVSRRPQRVDHAAYDEPLDLGLELVGKLEARAAEELDAVVLEGVVRGRDDHARVRPQ